MAFPNAWDEVCLISIAKKGGSDIEFAAIVETLDISEGDYPGESIPTLAGGRIWKQSPQEDGEITLEFYGVELDTTSGVGLAQQWNGGTYTTSEPLSTDSAWAAGVNRARDLFRVSILWTNDTTPATSGAGATAAATEAERFYATDCRIISHKSEMATDQPLKMTVVFKYPAFNKAGTTKNGIWQSGDATALATLGSYT